MFTFRKKKIAPNASYRWSLANAHLHAQRYLFISKRQPNYHDYRASLRNATTSLTLYLRTRNVTSSSWTTHTYAQRLWCYVSPEPASRISRALSYYPNRSISLLCSSDADYVNASLARPTTASLHPVCTQKGTSFFSHAPTRASDIPASAFPFRKIVEIRRRFIPQQFTNFPSRRAGCELLTCEYACDYFQTKISKITVYSRIVF